MDVSMKRGGEKKPFQVVPDPDISIVLLHQHIGEKNEALVDPGDKVLEGQKIGDSDEFLSAPVHSPISGEVVKIEDTHHPKYGTPSEAVFIQKGDVNQKPKRLDAFDKKELDDIDPETLVKIVREAGIVGLGGAAFPSHIKLSSRDKTKNLLINAKESDPNLTCDIRLMKEKPQEIVNGILAMARMLEVKDIVFASRGVEGGFPKLEKILNEEGISIARIRPCYSVGSDKLLIKEILDKEVPCEGLPPDVGALVHNVFTAYAASRAIFHGEPLISRGLTFISKETGPVNLWVKIGTPLSHIFNYLDVRASSFKRVVFGSIMMGSTVPNTNVPTTKSTAGITAFKPDERSPYEDSLPCIRCGYCNEVCPVDIYPVLIMEAEKKDDLSLMKKYHAEDCIDCGLCSYVCPSKIKLTEYLRNAAKKIKGR